MTFEKIKINIFTLCDFLSVDYLIDFGSTVIKNGLSISLIKDVFVCVVTNVTGIDIPKKWYTFNGVIWFLRALFFSEIFLYFTIRLLSYLINCIRLGDFLYNPIVEILLTVITMAIMAPIIYLSNKYLYFIFGKTRRKP